MAMAGRIPVGCGQCIPCRINLRRMWTARLMLESFSHQESCFVTLTYENMPRNNSLDPLHTKNWMKRFRKALEPLRIRFYLAGEYGDETQRPHYHAAIFGIGPHCEATVANTWKMGFVSALEFNMETAAYICGYVVKKMTRKDDPRLDGRYPEYSRKSNRPGIGAPAMEVIASQLDTTHGRRELEILGDVPHQLKLGKNKSLPLGRYLRSRLRKECGFSDEEIEGIKQAFISEKAQEMQDLFLVSRKDAEKEVLSPKKALLRKNQGRVWSVEAKARIVKEKKL